MLAQPHLGKAPLASGVQELIMANMRLMVSRDGCKVIQHGDLLTTKLPILTILTILANDTEKQY